MSGTASYLSKLDSAGNFKWVKVLGTSGHGSLVSFELDSLRNIYCGGQRKYTELFFDHADTLYSSSTSYYELYVARLGTHISYSGIIDQDLNVGMIIYPNPGSGEFEILLAGEIQDVYSVLVFNTLGQQLLNQVGSNKIDLSSEPDGIYFIQVLTEQGHFKQKIIKQ